MSGLYRIIFWELPNLCKRHEHKLEKIPKIHEGAEGEIYSVFNYFVSKLENGEDLICVGVK